jgi:transcriptional regulator with XRE-family HTH domain
MNLGQKVKKLRELKSLTQSDMAFKLGITQGAYSKLEIGLSDISYSKLTEIATVLNISVEDIIAFNNENLVFNLKNNKKANGLVINQMSANEKKVYQEYIESLKIENNYLKNMIEKLLNKK